MSPDSIPVLPRGVRLHEDRVRGGWVLLAPERALQLDDVGRAILSEVDGTRTLDAIAGTLADRYAAPKEAILTDSIEYLADLRVRRIVEVRP